MAEATVSTRTYFFVAGALFVLLGFTVGVYYVPLGAFSIVAALLIAGTKAAIIMLYFMHVRYSSRMTQVLAATGVFWLIILFAFTFGDYITRAWINPATVP